MKHSRSAYRLPLSLGSEVREAMTPGVVSIPSDASLAQARDAFVAHEIHALLVTDRTSRAPLGWITARGLLASATERGEAHTARQAISEQVTVVPPSASLSDAIELMLAADASHVLVAHRPDAAPEGVLSATDIIRAAART